jgi:hypothetical protein
LLEKPGLGFFFGTEGPLLTGSANLTDFLAITIPFLLSRELRHCGPPHRANAVSGFHGDV